MVVGLEKKSALLSVAKCYSETCTTHAVSSLISFGDFSKRQWVRLGFDCPPRASSGVPYVKYELQAGAPFLLAKWVV